MFDVVIFDAYTLHLWVSLISSLLIIAANVALYFGTRPKGQGVVASFKDGNEPLSFSILFSAMAIDNLITIVFSKNSVAGVIGTIVVFAGLALFAYAFFFGRKRSKVESDKEVDASKAGVDRGDSVSTSFPIVDDTPQGEKSA